MSFLGRNVGTANQVSKVMSADDVMNVAKGAPTPWNPGDNSEIRTEQVIARHKHFTKGEANQLREKAATRTRQAKTNRQAYGALKKIERADTSDQVTYRGYQTAVAGAAVSKKGADVAKANTLHGLAPRYAKMGYSLEAGHEEAATKVREYQNLYTEVSGRWN